MASQPTPNLPPTEIRPAIKSLFLGRTLGGGGWLTSHDKLEMIALAVQNLINDRHLFGDVFQNPLVKQGSLCHQTFTHIILRYTRVFIYLFVSVRLLLFIDFSFLPLVWCVATMFNSLFVRVKLICSTHKSPRKLRRRKKQSRNKNKDSW